MMSTFAQIATFGMLLIFFSGICLVILGQVTVKKLRKNSETKSELGLEVMSGFDIINVASALSAPEWMVRIAENQRYQLGANKRILVKNTNKFDRFLARLTWYSLLTGICLLLSYGIFSGEV
ncbi:exported hypothetical protein [Vibrio nigripulchritudo SO65]|uniref:hypothetical protein n=1 Tax=Vibrio nigripulchritudo TaxID=28173 RepID=UPI0003B1FA6F|nr:hypothetical protein [Vibrio nigripulchritudo]CCN35955.1 exported hypothetical protein [Vibrio nigripulchritudo AM115]CCN42826.1 exported hypothetical protein [Vibrio nigripulchritudo FTn2]CCN65820.1 exported hypothetical protein [Vibrio nigripulchritudo POn4]CCN76967.1 exported hypothetical protein [Vibrio nigripulchritudo SO65]